ncbi:hypothetical protein Taro_046746 [Colocasia esculenta]|uniref:Uncharacterized protein n=1 Tax=Colocasia esculenta TaxID=4460 RepID=A0A843WUI3_COLES|nr:hypothetical protein [Colocasia esculenta]
MPFSPHFPGENLGESSVGLPWLLVDGRAAHVHTCTACASSAVPRAFVPVFWRHVHLISRNPSASGATSNSTPDVGFLTSGVRVLCRRRLLGLLTSGPPGFGANIQTCLLLTSEREGSGVCSRFPQGVFFARGLFKPRYFSGSKNAPHGISVGEEGDGGYPVAPSRWISFLSQLLFPILCCNILSSDGRTIGWTRWTMPRKGRDKSGQGGRSGQGSRAPRRTENDVERTDDPMPCFTLSPVRVEDLDRLEGCVGPCVRGLLEEPSPVEGAVDVGRIDHSGLIYRYRRGAGYPKHFPLDEHLLPFIQNFMPANWGGPAGLLATERAQLERAILAGRDSMMGTCSPHHPSFPLDHEAQAHFPDTALLGLFAPESACRVTKLRLSQGLWEVQGLPKTGATFTGHTLPPSGRDFVQDGYDRSCFLDRILGGGAATHDFRPFCISVAVTSAAVLPTASPPEEGEVARGIAGDADGGYFFHSSEPSLSIPLARRMTGRERRRVPLCLLLDPSFLADGAEIAAEMMESSPPGAVLPPAVGTLHPPEGGDSASLPLGTQAVSGGLLPPSSSEAPLERPFSFPGHGISWPDAIQRSRVHGSEGMLDFYISSARAVMEESSPPSVDVVRDFLERSTVSYHLMGCP